MFEESYFYMDTVINETIKIDYWSKNSLLDSFLA